MITERALRTSSAQSVRVDSFHSPGSRPSSLLISVNTGLVKVNAFTSTLMFFFKDFLSVLFSDYRKGDVFLEVPNIKITAIP